MSTYKYTAAFNLWEIKWRDIEEDKIFTSSDKQYIRCMQRKLLYNNLPGKWATKKD